MDKYVKNLTDRQAEVEINAEYNIDQVQDMFSALLQDPSQRSEFIFDSFVISAVNKSSIDMDDDSSRQLGIRVAEYIDMTFDELNSIPTFDRSLAWEIATSAMVTAASKQAQTMSGLTQESMINGINNADDLQEAVDGMTEAELQAVQIDIKGTLKKKKNDRRIT